MLFFVLWHQPPTDDNYLTKRARLGLFFPIPIAFILLLNWIHSFVLELVVVSWCKFWGFAYARWDILDMTARFAGTLGMKEKLLISHFLPFVYREGVFGLAIQLCLGWSSRTLLQYGSGSLMSRHKLLFRSCSARVGQSALSFSTDTFIAFSLFREQIVMVQKPPSYRKF